MGVKEEKELGGKFTIYKNREADKIISTTLFFQSSNNKDTEKYREGLLQIIEDAQKEFPDYNVRIYFDQSSMSFVKTLMKFPNVELYYYLFPEFFDEEKKVHYGTFGTLVRYMPLFDFPDHSAKITIIFDTDSNLRGKTVKTIQHFEEKADLKTSLSNCMAYADLIHSLPSSVLLDLHRVIDYELKDRKYLKEQSWLQRMFKRMEYGV